MAAAYSFRSVVRAPPLPRGLAKAAVCCCSAAPCATSTSKLVLEIKERLEREHPSLPTGKNGRDDEEMILWFLKDRKFSMVEDGDGIRLSSSGVIKLGLGEMRCVFFITAGPAGLAFFVSILVITRRNY